MAEEPRRSGRSTKGQHTKQFDVESAPTPKRSSKSKSKKRVQKDRTPEPEEGAGEEIRCICGINEEDEDDEGRKYVCCDKCGVWQHNDCMEITEDENNLPENYFCELCRPADHKELLQKIKRGERPWEAAAKRREDLKKPQKKKSARRNRKSRQSEVKPQASEVVQAAKPEEAIQEPSPAKDHAESKSSSGKHVNGQKRKQVDVPPSQPPEQEPKPKVRKVSTTSTTSTARKASASSAPAKKESVQAPEAPPLPQPAKDALGQVEVVATPDDLQNEARKKAAMAMSNMFIAATSAAEKEGVFSIPEGSTAQSFGQRIAVLVEYSMYMNLCNATGTPNKQYRDKLRQILFNVKKNPALRNRLLTGEVTPDTFSTMSSDEMASAELQQKMTEMKKEVEKQHILIKEEGPRIRRTHKGEEFVGDDAVLEPSTAEPSYEDLPGAKRRESSFDQRSSSPRTQKAESTSPPESPKVELPVTDAGQSGFGESPARNALPKIDTNAGASTAISEPRKSSTTNFDIQNVWSSVHSQDTADRRRQSQSTSIGPASTPSKIQADPEIDKLLKDDDIESPPYSPTDFGAPIPLGIIWRGKVSMSGLSEFSCTGKFVAGADLSRRAPWSHFLPDHLVIDARLPVTDCMEYLCGLRFSQHTDLSIVGLSPPDSDVGRDSFNRMFQYFADRKRYGVISKHSDPNVIDIYVMPVEAGMGPKPEVVDLLDNFTLTEPRPEPLLLIALVYSIPPDNSQAFAGQDPASEHSNSANGTSSIFPPGNLALTPLTPSVSASPQAQTSYQPTAYETPTATTSYLPAHYQTTSYGTPQSSYSAYPVYVPSAATVGSPSQPVLTGRAAALSILGPQLANCPSMNALLGQAPGLGAQDMVKIKEVLDNVPQSRTDVGVLATIIQSSVQQHGGTMLRSNSGSGISG